MALSKDKILKHAGVFTPTVVHVPAWADESGDDVVLVRGMTIREFEINQARVAEGESTASVMARCILDETGGRLFDDRDVARLAELPLAQTRVIDRAIAQQSGLGEDEAKNSESPTVEKQPSGDSSSASPETSDAP